MWNKNAFNICATTHISLCLFGLSVNVLSVMCLHKLGLLGCFHTWTSSELSCRINCRLYLLLMVLSKSRFGQEKYERSVKWKSTGWFYEKRCQGNRMLFITMRNSLEIRTGNTQFWRNAILSFSSQMNRIKIAFFCETHTKKNSSKTDQVSPKPTMFWLRLHAISKRSGHPEEYISALQIDHMSC